MDYPLKILPLWHYESRIQKTLQPKPWARYGIQGLWTRREDCACISVAKWQVFRLRKFWNGGRAVGLHRERTFEIGMLRQHRPRDLEFRELGLPRPHRAARKVVSLHLRRTHSRDWRQGQHHFYGLLDGRFSFRKFFLPQTRHFRYIDCAERTVSCKLFFRQLFRRTCLLQFARRLPHMDAPRPLLLGRIPQTPHHSMLWARQLGGRPPRLDAPPRHNPPRPRRARLVRLLGIRCGSRLVLVATTD